MSDGDEIRVRHTSGVNYSTQTSTALDVGGQSVTLTSVTQDVPDSLTLTPSGDQNRSDVELDDEVRFTAVSVNGLAAGAQTQFTVSGDGQADINTESGTPIRSVNSGMVGNGDTITVYHRSGMMYESDTMSTLVVGGAGTNAITIVYTSTTELRDVSPEISGGGIVPLGDNGQGVMQYEVLRTRVMAGDSVRFDPVSIRDINDEIAGRLDKGTLEIRRANGVDLDIVSANQPFMISNDNRIVVRHDASMVAGAEVHSTVELTDPQNGRELVVLMFTSRVENPAVEDPDDVEPDLFSFIDEPDPELIEEMGTDGNTVYYAVSNSITVSGLAVGVTAPVVIENGEYCIETTFDACMGMNAIWVRHPMQVSNGQRIRVRHAREAGQEGTVNTTLTVSNVEAEYVSGSAPISSGDGGYRGRIGGGGWALSLLPLMGVSLLLLCRRLRLDK